MIENLTHIVEAIIFASDEPISKRTLADIIKSVANLPDEDDDFLVSEIDKSVLQLNENYDQNNSAFNIIRIGGGYQYATRKEFSKFVGYLNAERNKKRLSQAALETLAIIAYKQPITKPELERIRGVNADYIISSLLEKNLIRIKGRAETVGRPLLYETTKDFLMYFGINDIQDLPKPREIEEIMKDEEFQEQKSRLLMNLIEEEAERPEITAKTEDE